MYFFSKVSKALLPPKEARTANTKGSQKKCDGGHKRVTMPIFTLLLKHFLIPLLKEYVTNYTVSVYTSVFLVALWQQRQDLNFAS